MNEDYPFKCLWLLDNGDCDEWWWWHSHQFPKSCLIFFLNTPSCEQRNTTQQHQKKKSEKIVRNTWIILSTLSIPKTVSGYASLPFLGGKLELLHGPPERMPHGQKDLPGQQVSKSARWCGILATWQIGIIQLLTVQMFWMHGLTSDWSVTSFSEMAASHAW